MLMNLEYYFDYDFLCSLDLSYKKYSIDFIIKRIIYLNKKINNNIILNTILSQSRKEGRLNFYILKENIKSFIIRKDQKYLDYGNKIKSILL